MMGERRVDQAALFYTFSLEDHVPANHLLRSIDRFVELEGLRAHLAPFYSPMGGPSIDPELLIRMLLVGYATNYLIDLKHAVIVDVEASTAVRPAELTAARTMIERVRDRHDLHPDRLAADTAYGSAEMLEWLVNDQGIAPHIPIIDKSGRTDGTFSRADFTYDPAADLYRCPAGKELKQYRRASALITPILRRMTPIAIAPPRSTATPVR